MAEERRWNRIAAEWWREMQPNNKRQNPAGNRAALAKLRRCGRIADAGSIPEALDLARRVGIRHGLQERLGDVLLAAIVLSHVRDEDDEPVARQLGRATAGQGAPMSPLRFARLLSAETLEERLVAFRRAVALLGNKANVADLAQALLDWSERTRIDWAFAYHERQSGTNLPASPPAIGETI